MFVLLDHLDLRKVRRRPYLARDGYARWEVLSLVQGLASLSQTQSPSPYRFGLRESPKCSSCCRQVMVSYSSREEAKDISVQLTETR